MHELALSSDHVWVQGYTHMKSVFSISLTDSALHCSQTQPVYVTLCCVTYTTMVYVLQYLHAISVVVLIHGIIILCNPLQPTVSCKYPLLL